MRSTKGVTMRRREYSSNQIVWEVVGVLEWLKWEHSREDECSIWIGGECDCGAEEVNVIIDDAIDKLKLLLGD